MPEAENQPEIGAEGSAEMVVGESDLASSFSTRRGERFPPVFATARMIALMETAASRVLEPLLQPGELSAGVSVEIVHSAATPVGAKVNAKARYLGRDGRLFHFAVTAEDAGGEIGSGTHKRAIVSEERLIAGARRRNGGG